MLAKRSFCRSVLHTVYAQYSHARHHEIEHSRWNQMVGPWIFSNEKLRFYIQSNQLKDIMVGEAHFIPFGPLDNIILKDEFTFEDVKTVHCVARKSKTICSRLIKRANEEKLRYLTICIPAYNENVEEMIKTLVSLLENIEFMQKKASSFPEFVDVEGIIEEFQSTVPIIVPIFDGTKAISGSMRGWIEKNFPGLLDGLQPVSTPGLDSIDVRIGCSEWWYLCDYEEKERLAKERQEQTKVETGNAAVNSVIENILRHFHTKRQEKAKKKRDEPFFLPVDKVFRESEHELFRKSLSYSSFQNKTDSMLSESKEWGSIEFPFETPTVTPERTKLHGERQNEIAFNKPFPSLSFDEVSSNNNSSGVHSIKNRFGEEIKSDSDRIIQFYVCPIVKRSNHRKHNSHQWFFDAICDGLEDKTIFALLTDCGTSYAENCVARLVVELFRMPDLIGATARQRVETPNRYFHPCVDAPYEWMQGKHEMGSAACWKCWLTFLMSPCPLQGVEFEGSSTVCLAMFNLVEALPVMPGPCQLMHWQKMKRFQVVDEYFNLLFEGENEKIALPELPRSLMPMKGICSVEEGKALENDRAVVQIPESSKATMTFAEFLRSNMRLAEDRILSFVSIFSTGYGTKWVLGATFYYQPEIQWNTLLTQRRRWTNGTFAGFLFCFVSPRATSRILGGMFDPHKLGKSIRAIYFLWSLQVVILAYLVVSSAIFGAGSYQSLVALSYNWPEAFSWAITPVFNENVRVVEVLAAVYVFVYASWMILSFYAPRGKMSEGLCQALAVYCCISVMPMYISIWRTLALHGINILVVLVIFNLFIPVIISIGEDMKSAVLYLLYLPWLLTLIMFFIVFTPAYAFSRLWDTTWGNRITGKDSAVNDSMESFIKKKNFQFILFIISVNISLFWAFVKIFSLGYTAIVIFMFTALFPILIQIIGSALYFAMWRLRKYVLPKYSKEQLKSMAMFEEEKKQELAQEEEKKRFEGKKLASMLSQHSVSNDMDDYLPTSNPDDLADWIVPRLSRA